MQIAISCPMGTLRGNDLEARLDRCVAAGWKMLRTDFYFQDRAAGWAEQERVVTAATARGIAVLPILAGPRNNDYVDTRDERKAFARWAGEAARRFEGRISRWQVGNEPNVINQPPAVYADLLKRTAARVRDAQPKATIVLAGLSPTPDGTLVRLPAVQYVRDLYAAGCKGVFDVLASHYYSKGLLPSAPDGWGGWPILLRIRGVMEENGDDAPVWITEFGVTTRGPGAAAEQAQVDILKDALRIRPRWLKRIFWYTAQDFGAQDTSEGGFGAYHLDGSAKPIVAYMKALAG